MQFSAVQLILTIFRQRSPVHRVQFASAPFVFLLLRDVGGCLDASIEDSQRSQPGEEGQGQNADNDGVHSVRLPLWRAAPIRAKTSSSVISDNKFSALI